MSKDSKPQQSRIDQFFSGPGLVRIAGEIWSMRRRPGRTAWAIAPNSRPRFPNWPSPKSITVIPDRI